MLALFKFGYQSPKIGIYKSRNIYNMIIWWTRDLCLNIIHKKIIPRRFQWFFCILKCSLVFGSWQTLILFRVRELALWALVAVAKALLKGDRWQMTGDKQHATNDTWHMSCDKWHNKLFFSIVAAICTHQKIKSLILFRKVKPSLGVKLQRGFLWSSKSSINVLFKFCLLDFRAN